MTIVALDLGKFKSVACVLDSDGGSHVFETLRTDPEVLEEWLGKKRPDRVVIEVGPSSGWVADVVEALGIALEVANPNHEGWRWRNVKRKTDRLDALKLARLSVMGQLPQVYMPSRRVRQWRWLIHYRQSLVRRRTRIKNQIRSILDREGLKLPPSTRGWTRASIGWLAGLSCPLEEAEPEGLWRAELYEELKQLAGMDQSIGPVEQKLAVLAQQDERVAQVQSIPGVGPRLAETVVAVLDDPHRFRRGKQVASYVGLTPRQHQSGSRDRQGGISGQGHSLLRSLLVEVSWLGLRTNGWMREVFERVCGGRACRRKIAVVAVARRLLIRCWVLLRDGRRWSMDPPSPQRCQS